MTTRSEDIADDEFWRRPSEPERADSRSVEPPAADMHSPSPAYSGPPSPPPPPPNWRPPVVVTPPPPRQLPVQDHDRLDAEEHRARTLTYGIGIAAGIVLIAVVCLLCVRVIG